MGGGEEPIQIIWTGGIQSSGWGGWGGWGGDGGEGGGKCIVIKHISSTENTNYVGFFA